MFREVLTPQDHAILDALELIRKQVGDEAFNQIIAQGVTDKRMNDSRLLGLMMHGKHWLVWSHEHGAWWGPDHGGYYTHVEHAGRYNFTEASQICHYPYHRTGDIKYKHEVGLPSEVMVPSPELAKLIETIGKLGLYDFGTAVGKTRRWTGEVCKRCLRRNTVGFDVSDEEWEQVAGKFTLLCLTCFDELAELAGVKYTVLAVHPVTWAHA